MPRTISGSRSRSSLGNVQGDCDAAFDRSGVLNVCYVQKDSADLYYAKNWNGVWEPEALATGDGVHATNPSIAMDSKGFAHICFYENLGSDLWYMTNIGGTWTTWKYTTGLAGAYPSIALDGNDKAHICFQVNPDHDLWYATNAGGNWATELIDSAGNCGYYGSIVIDSQGRRMSATMTPPTWTSDTPTT